ncbi:MAG: prepilin-type N-terminal cleavage/methylation domain-containing protein [Methylococcales bacterium]|nr:prepilin-type N-terminal cleavage/methylation domain-containing protein [Methylococcales bacterium]
MFKREGFTLVEVLLAMALLSLVMVLLLASLSISIRSWDGGERKLDAVSEAAAFSRFWLRHVAQAQPLWQASADNGVQAGGASNRSPEGFSFQGDSAFLQFAAWLPDSAARPGPHWFQVAISQENNHHNLTVAVKPFDPPPDGGEWPWDSVILVDDIQDFALRYFGGDRPGEPPYWQTLWQDKIELPQLVGVSWLGADGLAHPELVIRLRNAEPTAEDARSADDAP